jgi:hypothetical protein
MCLGLFVRVSVPVQCMVHPVQWGCCLYNCSFCLPLSLRDLKETWLRWQHVLVFRWLHLFLLASAFWALPSSCRCVSLFGGFYSSVDLGHVCTQLCFHWDQAGLGQRLSEFKQDLSFPFFCCSGPMFLLQRELSLFGTWGAPNSRIQAFLWFPNFFPNPSL